MLWCDLCLMSCQVSCSRSLMLFFLCVGAAFSPSSLTPSFPSSDAAFPSSTAEEVDGTEISGYLLFSSFPTSDPSTTEGCTLAAL